MTLPSAPRRVGERARAAVLVSGLGGVLTGGCTACGSDPADGAGGATVGSTSDAATTITSTAGNSTVSTGSVDANGCTVLPNPPGVPDGFIEWTDWSCNCRFYIPGSKAAMPAAIEWEDCPPEFGNVDCRMMKVDWTASKQPTAATAHLNRNPDGTAVLKFRRIALDAPDPYVLDLVADADGPVRSALLWPPKSAEQAASLKEPGCFSGLDDFKEGYEIFSVEGDSTYGDPDDESHEGAIGRAMDEPAPRVLAHYVDELNYGFKASAKWVFRSELPSFSRYAMPWSMSPETFVTSPAVDPDNLAGESPIAIGDALFWVTDSGSLAGINVWDPVNGARPFIRWAGDTTKGAADFGTDGVDMVWSYGEGQVPQQEWGYAVQSIMTAKFTTDPAAVVTTRLRSLEGIVGRYAFQVGCGYGAVRGNENDLWVVRLSDGVAWNVKGPWGSTANNIAGGPIGVTCDHVFVLGYFGDRLNLARVKISSLGPGLPAD